MYLDILHVFYTYPRPVQDTFWDTHQIHQDTCICSLPMCHTGYTTRYIKIHQDTCIFVKIHQDTTGYKITIHVSWMRHDDTSGYIRDTSRYMYILDASSEPRWIHTRYVRDAMQIRSGYAYPGLVLFALLPKELKAKSQHLHLHPRSRRKARELWQQHLHLPRQLRSPRSPSARSPRSPSAHPIAATRRDRDTYLDVYPDVSDTYRECILCVMYLRVKIHDLECILNVS